MYNISIGVLLCCLKIWSKKPIRLFMNLLLLLFKSNELCSNWEKRKILPKVSHCVLNQICMGDIVTGSSDISLAINHCCDGKEWGRSMVQRFPFQLIFDIWRSSCLCDFLFTDSKFVFSWFHAHPHLLKLYVGYSVVTILDMRVIWKVADLTKIKDIFSEISF